MATKEPIYRVFRKRGWWYFELCNHRGQSLTKVCLGHITGEEARQKLAKAKGFIEKGVEL